MNTEEFIYKHRKEDVRKLALQGKKYPEVDMAYALNQIQGWQTASKKLPSWSAVEGIIYPPHLNMEQCSSEETALYKAGLGSGVRSREYMVDLTGGFGVDFSFLSRNFKRATYVERNPELCQIAKRNFSLLGLKNTEIVCGDSVEYLKTMEPVDLIYIDPARRDDKGSRTYAIEDCTPNVIELQDLLLEKAKRVIIKLSPMLDWHKAVKDLKNVTEVHIVAVGNECKELLLVINDNVNDNIPTVYCVNDGQQFRSSGNPEIHSFVIPEIRKGQTLLVPNAAIMKAGVFSELCEQFHICQIAPSSHLFISEERMENFPGRQFCISGVYTMNKKDLKELVSTISSANISTRNFPLTPEQLRKKLKLKDGGKDFIFATTDSQNNHILILAYS